MRLRREHIEYAKRATVASVVSAVAKAKKITSEEALRQFAQTMTFEALQSDKGRLYLESTEYVLDMLKSELEGDLESWLQL